MIMSFSVDNEQLDTLKKIQEDIKYIVSKQEIIPSKLSPVRHTIASECIKTSKGDSTNFEELEKKITNLCNSMTIVGKRLHY